MAFRLKKKYTAWDMVAIPFSCDPLASSAVLAQKVLSAASAVIQVPAAAKFIDSSVAAAKGHTSLNAAVLWFVILAICVGWRRVSYMIGRYFSDRMSSKAEADLKLAFTEKRARLHYRHIESPESWDLINRVTTDLNDKTHDMQQCVANLFISHMGRFLGILIIVFTQVWWMGIVSIAICILLMFISLKSGKANYTAVKEASVFDRHHQYLSEVLTGREAADERALFGFSGHVGDMWRQQYEAGRKIRLKASIKRTITIRGGSMFAMLLSSFIMLLLVFPAASGQITIGMFIGLSTAMYEWVEMMGWHVSYTAAMLSRLREWVRDIGEFSNLEEVEGAESCPAEEILPFQSLEFKAVSFCYPGTQTYILKNISLLIEKDTHYAFVGVNGAGKTTIIKLITGLYDNYEGEILLNGKNLQSYTHAQLKAMFSGVYQDFAKYYIPLKDNVLVGNVNRMRDGGAYRQMVDTLKTLELYQDLIKLPQGLDTPLGKILEGGVDISGGQWQRLAMARTLINPAPVLILDEPTAALDPISESKLYERFEKISEGKTTIFISHRLGSTKLSDKIFVLSEGSVAEQGSHAELMELGGVYAKMYESQRSWYTACPSESYESEGA